MPKILITSALPYVNGVKHLGNLVGSLLPADVHARFRRQIGDEVLFICATDEHGTPAELGAIQAGQDIQTFCNEQHAIQAHIYRRFGLSFDHFGRTLSSRWRKAGSPPNSGIAASRATSSGVWRCRVPDSKRRSSMSGSMRQLATSRQRKNGPTPITAIGGNGGGTPRTSNTSSFSART